MRVRLWDRPLWRGFSFATGVVLMTAGFAFAQAATSTINGRVLDQGDAVLPGVTVTATNTSTGVVRTTVTNGEGIYSMPGLEPGVYDVKTELAGFAPATRDRVTVAVNSTITIDFGLRLAGVEEALTVTGEAPLIEVTQSKVASSIEVTELQNLPSISRTVSGMLELLPGAAPVAELHRTKTNVGTVSYGGSSGANVIPTVDGADNRDNHYGGPLMSYSTESLEQFQLATSQFTAADGRTGGAAVTMLTKSGTNVLHGSAFVFARDRKLTAKDYFTKQSNSEKVPFSRQQFGGSIGGPVVRNRVFFFGAVEQWLEDTGLVVSDTQYNEHEVLVNATRAGLIPSGLVNPNHPRFGPQPGSLRMMSFKSNAQLTSNHSLMGRYASQRDTKDAVTYQTSPVTNDLRETENSIITAQSGVVQHNWVLGNRGLNQITGQVNHMQWFSDSFSLLTGQHYYRDFPNVDIFPPRLAFPTVNTGAGGSAGVRSNRYVIQIKEDLSLQVGTHAIRLGANYNELPNLGIVNANEHFVTLTFFDDPSTILTNRTRYPQGFQTPGIVRQWQQANGGAVGGQGYLSDTTTDARQFGTWLQDDWRMTSKLTLNLGVRYDVDFNLMDQEHHEFNATRQILEAIGNPYGGFPKTPTKDISPRVGFAYDLSGDGGRVLRGGYGLYFDQYNTAAAAGDITAQGRRPLNALATLTNTAIGVGQLATYRFGIDPLPPQPTEGDSLPPNSAGQWLDPAISDPRTHQAHIGYAHTLAQNTVLSVDYTHVEGRKEMRQLNLNPVVNGTRVMVPDFIRVYGVPNVLSAVNIRAGINKSRYDALTFRFQRRFPRATFQAHYTLAGAYSYGGSTGNRSGAGLAQDAFDPFAKGEWGPNGPDERHRLVATGVFDLPYGLQLSPILQAASARPYNLTAGTDLNADGTNNDRYIDPATGTQASYNSARGDNTTLLDLRATKFIELGEERRIGVFVEFFNLFNTANFGGQYSGNARSVNFRQPTGYIPSIGYPRQVQLGARFLF
jgi:Carboxypeptidase regulatory-like domain/TonB dependent receptor-like, beta-barrel